MGAYHLVPAVRALPRIPAEQRQVGRNQLPFVIGNVGRLGILGRGYAFSFKISAPQFHNILQIINAEGLI
jgi:hypothetical protein